MSFIVSRFRVPSASTILGAALLASVLSGAVSGPAIAAPAPPPKATGKPVLPPPRTGRDILLVDGAWRFATDPDRQGEAKGWPNAIPDMAGTTNILAVWNAEAAPKYRGAAWYWRTIDVPPTWKGQTVRLQLGAVAERATVWFNGSELGTHEGGATPFEFNVTKTLKLEGGNLIAVRAESNDPKAAGIWQGVTLVSHDEAYLSDVFPQPDALGHISTAIEIQNTSQNSGVAILDARIVDPKTPNRDLKKTNQNLSATPGRNITTLETGIKGKNLHRWSLETPNLYSLLLLFRQDKDVLDTQNVMFGFRQFGFADGGILLNGEPLTLRALDLASAEPFAIPTEDAVEKARSLVRRAKEQGVTVLYFAAPPPTLLRVADEEGMLIVESARPNVTGAARTAEIQALIRRDRAHPSLLAWELDDMSLADVKACRLLDTTRFFLIGARTGAKAAPTLWLPGDNALPTDKLPPGLLPTR